VKAAFRHLALIVSLGAAGLLAACGGGTQVEKFVPTRLLALGDENSVLVDSGDHNARKYTVNTIPASTSTPDCKTGTIWVQYLAVTRGLVFPECNYGTGAVTDPPSRIYARPDAKVGDLDAQIAAHGGLGNFRDSDLVAIFIGVNDVIEQFEKLDDLGEAQVVANIETLGDRLAAKVNALASTGARVLVLAVPDLSYTPYAARAEATRPGSLQLLSRLSKRFNTRLGFSIIQDGHLIALMKANDVVQSLVQNVGINVLVNVTDPVCDATKAASVLDCTTGTLVTDGSATTWLWADDRHLSPAGHSFLGQAAATQVDRNPF
jgi:outer membrane lipase/esterase